MQSKLSTIFLFFISSVSIYYGTQPDIRVRTQHRWNFLESSVFNFERLDILWDLIGHPRNNLLLFEFSWIFCFLFRAARYITGLNRPFEQIVIAVCICSNLLFLIFSVSIYYVTQQHIPVKRYCRLNFHGSCVFNSERIDILRDSIGHSSKKLLPFEFARIFYFLF